jgi:PAS domain S-box-containing protein
MEHSFRTVIEGAPDGVLISRDGAILYVNASAARMLGFGTPAPLLGRSLAEFLTPDDARAMRDRIRVLQETGKPLPPREYPAIRADGTILRAEITSLPFVWEGQPAMLAFARDVTERVQVREQLARTDRLVALGTLAAGVAHEINNPVASMSLAAEAVERILLRALSDEDSRNQALALLSEIRHGSERVTGIVRDLRAFARTDEALPQPVMLGPILAAVARVTTHALQPVARLRTDYADVPPVVGNPGRLEQVLVNLLLNAAQAFPQAKPENEVLIRAALAGERVMVEVRDNGVGIPPEHLKRIFDPFFTTKPVGVGTGLGLFISHAIVSQLGGELQAESELGRGTTMRMLLEPATASPIRPEIPAPRPSVPPARILIIDDDRSLLFTLKFTLQERHMVTTASSGEEALGLLTVPSADYDLVLCDLMMSPLSGMDVHERLRAIRPDIADRMVFMTGGAFTERAAGFLASVENPRLEKPFLSTAVEALLPKQWSYSEQ